MSTPSSSPVLCAAPPRGLDGRRLSGADVTTDRPGIDRSTATHTVTWRST
eukprot:CAMPEP_0202112718 /NCGR_PEP_ID=MMETSP0965-20130614/32270_1 /ASSEMBLY_ACC=CAM_ASM_000507 /TAXON_ID=4773 /ORGANISM="Schizochytrium aggregatum, Strain ATCC28209" /LENGTH=49 /DNA_ID= /DNA_START= /DNA_END= /DNA_ORIENTATION=